MTKIKICGITNLEDAMAIANLDVDYLGFIINYPSSLRSISKEKVAAIIKKVKLLYPRLKFVGVFVDQKIDKVKSAVEFCKIDVVQLHGSESPEYCRKLKGTAEVWKTIIIKNKGDVKKIEAYRNVVDKIMVDSGKGSGTAIDRSALQGVKFDVLAGGLGLDNIKAAISELHPKVVDLNSGVEIKPGRKDVECIRKIIFACHPEGA